MVDWNVYGLALVPPAIAVAALAIIVFRARPSSSQNQSLAMMLAGAGFLGAGLAFGYLTEDVGISRGGFGVAYSAWFCMLVASLRFSAALGAPWLGFLRHRWVDRVILLLFFLGPIFASALILRFTFSGMGPYTPYVRWRPVFYPGAFETWNAVSILFNLVAIAAAAHAWQRQPIGSPLRRTMGTYFAAAVFVEAIAMTSQVIRADIIASVQDGAAVATWKVPTFLLSIVFQMIVYPLGYGYAILRSQVFDVDLRIKWTLQKGTVAAAFIGVFFIVSEGAQTVLTDQIGPVAGLLAAGALVFLIAPLQRFADRIGDTAMPHVKDTAEYRTVRKREVYRAAVESALEEGGEISHKERGMLATLAEQLGIAPKEMYDIERDARKVRGMSEKAGEVVAGT